MFGGRAKSSARLLASTLGCVDLLRLIVTPISSVTLNFEPQWNDQIERMQQFHCNR